jgi:hypothetical protein
MYRAQPSQTTDLRRGPITPGSSRACLRATPTLVALAAAFVTAACGGSISYDHDLTGGGAGGGSAGAKATYNAATPSPSSSEGGAAATDMPVKSSAAVKSSAGEGGSAEERAGAAGSAGAPSTTDAGGVAISYVASLQSYWSVPRVATRAAGAATFTLSADKKTLSYHLTQNVEDAAEAQIHLGAAGEDGAVVYALQPLGTDMTGVISLTGANDLANLEEGKLYVSVQSFADSGVQIRGQILHPDETLYVANLIHGWDTLPGAATTTGTAQLIVAANKRGFRYHLQSAIATPISAYIGKGVATAGGEELHQFVPAQAIDGEATFADGEANDLAHGRWYAALEATTEPGTEIRGQLILPGETRYEVALAGSNENPSVDSEATGNGQFILSADRTLLRYELALFGLDPTFVQIAKGGVAVTGPVVYPLTLAPGYSGTPGALAGAAGVRAVTTEDLADLAAGNWYVNARDAAFPTGAVRGQIMPALP